MNFDLSEEHNEITDLATKILDDHVTMENLKEVEVSGDWFDRPLWEKFVSSGLIGATLNEHGAKIKTES